MNNIKSFVADFESLSSDSKRVEILLYGDSWCNDNKDHSVLPASLCCFKKTKRFDCSLFG